MVRNNPAGVLPLRRALSEVIFSTVIIIPLYLCAMKFQIGDKVLILHSNEEGEVVDIINNKMVMVDVRGVKFPAYIDQLDFPYFKRFSEKKLFPEKKKQKSYIDNVKKEKERVNERR